MKPEDDDLLKELKALDPAGDTDTRVSDPERLAAISKRVSARVEPRKRSARTADGRWCPVLWVRSQFR
jgi:hypothetical protein